tara:strand:+ start:349 stop:576 length:228 start_codon:yes stop_codon:yes gene_type:complete
MKMQSINFTKTGGQFGRKRVLPTFIIEEFKTDSGKSKFMVTDERNPEQGMVGCFFSLDQAIDIFKPMAERRTRLF